MSSSIRFTRPRDVTHFRGSENPNLCWAACRAIGRGALMKHTALCMPLTMQTLT